MLQQLENLINFTNRKQILRPDLVEAEEEEEKKEERIPNSIVHGKLTKIYPFGIYKKSELEKGLRKSWSYLLVRPILGY